MDAGFSSIPAPAASIALSIVIPAYNAAAHIGTVVAAVRAKAPAGAEILVVDDGSDDGTADHAERAGALVLRHAGNRGKGAALQTGFAHALSRGARAVMTLDADGQHDPEEIPMLFSVHQGQPEALVIGVRSFDPALMPRRSRIGNHISTYFISIFSGRQHRDTQSGFRVYPAALLSRVRLTTRRFETETELILWAAKTRTPLCQVPIRTIYHGPGPGPEHGAPEGEGETAPAHATHFRTFEDTLRVLRLVIGSPFWREEAPQANPQPKLETT